MAGFEIQFEALDAASPTIQRLSKELLTAALASDRFAKDVTVNTGKVDEALKKVPATAKEAATSMETLQKAGEQLADQFLKFATVAGIGAFFKDSAAAALEDEAALNRLAFAVDATTGNYGAMKDEVKAFAAQIEATTRFSDTNAYEALAKLTRITGDVGQAMTATKLVFGLSEASGKDFTTTMEALSPILQGDSSRLRALKQDFGSFIGDAQTAQQVIDALSKKFLNTAENADSYGKSLKQSQHAMENFQKQVGSGILPGLTMLAGGLTKVFELLEIIGTVTANYTAKAFVLLSSEVKDFNRDMEELGLQIAEVGVKAMLHITTLGKQIVAGAKGDFELVSALATEKAAALSAIEEDIKAKQIARDADVKASRKETASALSAIEEASMAQATEIHERYNAKKTDAIVKTAAIHVNKTRETLAEEKKAGDEIMKLIADRLEAEGKASGDVRTMELASLRSKLIMFDVERQARIRSFEEMRQKGLITASDLTRATIESNNIAMAKSTEARNAISDDFLVLKGTADAVGSSISSSFGKAVADIILEGKSLEEAMKQVFDQILRTAIETFVQIAIQRAIISAAAGAATGGAGGGAAAGAGFFGLPGMAEGGIVTRPTIAMIGEAGKPEAVIPLDRLGPILDGRVAGGSSGSGVSVTQHNMITISGKGMSDEDVRDLTRKIAEATRSGAAEGAELAKSISLRQSKSSREAV